MVAKVIHGAPYIAGSVTVALGLSKEEWMVTGVIVGIFCTVITTVANVAYKMYLVRKDADVKA